MGSGRIRKIKPTKNTSDRKPSAPSYLDDLARVEYAKLVEVLAESGNLAKTDPRLIEAYAGNYSLMVRAITELNTAPLVTGDKGRSFVNPLVGIVHNSTQKVRQVIADLGLSPSSAKAVADNLPGVESSEKWAKLVD